MKRPLPVLGESTDVNERGDATPCVVRVGDAVVRVWDTGDGDEARRFSAFLVGAGGTWLDSVAADATRTVVIRSAFGSTRAHVRADELERTADFVLGSARSAFAERLASALRG